METATEAFPCFDDIDDLETSEEKKNYLSFKLIMFIDKSMRAMQIVDSSTCQALFENFSDTQKCRLTVIELRMAKILAQMEPQEGD
uniref:BESS domain-containing protein n=1 Tax=Trichuris muris TaxID=70415 RepID=A0A5S6Q1K8_TRIMR